MDMIIHSDKYRWVQGYDRRQPDGSTVYIPGHWRAR